MPRKKKYVHGCPEKAGEQNFPAGYIEKHKDTMGIVKPLVEAYNIGQKNRQDYKGQYDEESLAEQINKFFAFCDEKDIKPANVGLCIWLGISEKTMYAWAKEDGFKGKLLDTAFKLIQWNYQERIEQYPTGNIFLLKAVHGVQDTTKVEVTNQNNVSKDEVTEAISKLGLDADDDDANNL